MRGRVILVFLNIEQLVVVEDLGDVERAAIVCEDVVRDERLSSRRWSKKSTMQRV